MSLTAANVLTAGRLVLLVVFWGLIAAGQIERGAVVFAVAWVLDSVDGWLARSLKQETAFGSWFDKVVDRLMIAGSVFVLLVFQILPDYGLLLVTKDIGTLPALTLHAAAGEPVAGFGWMGRALTLLQGAGILWLLADVPAGRGMVGVVAVLGGLAATVHLYQVAYGVSRIKK